jgi:hypothetical protein
MEEIQNNKDASSEWEDASSGRDFEENEELLGEGATSPVRQPHNSTRIQQLWFYFGFTTINITILCLAIFIFTLSRQSCESKFSERAAFLKTQAYCTFIIPAVI